MNNRILKTLWHVFMAGSALYEYTESESNFRKLLCAGMCGWHVGAAVIDWKDESE